MSSCITHGNHGNPREGARIGRAGHTHREMAQSQSREVPRWALVATAVTATSLGILWWTTSARSKKKKLPEPEGCHPIWGGIPLLAKLMKPGDHIDTAIDLIIKQQPKLGRFFKMRFVVIDFAAVTDPAAAWEATVTHNLPKSSNYRTLYPFIGRKSLVVAEGKTWSRLRKAFTPAFATQYLRSLVPLFVENGLLLLPRLDTAADEQSVVLIHNELTLLTLDIITKAFISLDFGYLDPRGPPESFHVFSELLARTAEVAEQPHKNILRFLPWKWLRFQYLSHKFNSSLVPEIRRRLKESEADAAARAARQGGRVDMFTMAMRAVREEGTTLALDDVLAQVKTFLFAGHDTTSSTLSFAIYEISRHPEVEAKLLKEVDSVCKGQLPTAEHVNQLKYAHAVMKETLRLWPVGGTARQGAPGITIQGYDVGNTVLYIPLIHMHRDPAIWGPDAGEFVPERWLDEAFIASLHPCAYMPFSKGPRDCIGQTFAMMESKALLALLYQRYTFKYAGDAPEEQGQHITSYPKHHVPVTVHRRRRV